MLVAVRLVLVLVLVPVPGRELMRVLEPVPVVVVLGLPTRVARGLRAGPCLMRCSS